MRRAQLCLRGLLAVLALTFIAAMPVVADPSDLGITLEEILEIVEGARAPDFPFEVEHKPNGFDIMLDRGGFVVLVHARSAEGSSADLEVLARQLIVRFTGKLVNTNQFKGKAYNLTEEEAYAEFDRIADRIWKRAARTSDDSGVERMIKELKQLGHRDAAGNDMVLARMELVNGMRASAAIVGLAGLWVVYDTYVDCVLPSPISRSEAQTYIHSHPCPPRGFEFPN